MTMTLDHQQIQYALKEFDIKEEDYYLLFDQSVYMVWCTTGTKAWELVTKNSCVSLNYRNQWYYLDEILGPYVVPSYACVRYLIETN